MQDWKIKDKKHMGLKRKLRHMQYTLYVEIISYSIFIILIDIFIHRNQLHTFIV